MDIRNLYDKYLHKIKLSLANNDIALCSSLIDETVTFISMQSDETDKIVYYENLLSGIINDTMLKNTLFVNNSFRKLVNLVSFYNNNDAILSLTCIIFHLNYCRENLIPLWVIKGLIEYSIQKEEVVAAFPEKTPFSEHFDLFHLIHSYNKEIIRFLNKYNNLEFLYDPMVRNKSALFLSTMAEKHTIAVVSDSLSVHEAVILLFLMSLFSAKSIENVTFYVNDEVGFDPFQCVCRKLFNDFKSQNNCETMVYPEIEFRNTIKKLSEFRENATVKKIVVNSIPKNYMTQGEFYYLISSIDKNLNGEIIQSYGPEMRSSSYREKFVRLQIVSLNYGSTISINDFYKTLRNAKSEETVKELLKKYSMPKNLSDEEQLVLSDIYCRAGYFSRAFAIVKNKYSVKPSASYRVLKSIIKHTKNEKLIEKCKRFIDDTELHISGFSAELVDVLNDEIERFIDKTKITKHKDIWL